MKARMMSGLGVVGLLAACGTGASTPSELSPFAGNLIDLRILPAAEGECMAYSGSVREMGAVPAALLTAVLPKLIDTGVASLGAALYKASGEDDKTAVSEGTLTTSAYDYDAKFKLRSWSKDLVCLKAEAGGGTFSAAFVVRQSSDGSAIAFKLAKLTYKEQLKAGRDLDGMTMALVIKDVGGTEVANGVFAGPFTLSKTDYVAGSNTASITTPWMPLPPVGDALLETLTSYEEQCAIREEAIRQYIDSETAKAKAKKTPLDPAISLQEDEARGLCGGRVMLPQVLTGSGWTLGSEKLLSKLEGSLRRQVPITIQLLVTETRDVNRFLLKMSEALVASKDAVTTALVAELDPANKMEAAKTANALKQDYDIALAQFEEKVRLYNVAVAAAKAAEAKYSTAQGGGNADSIAKAAEAVKEALAGRAAAFEAALSARKTARQAAYAADVSVSAGSRLAKFPS